MHKSEGGGGGRLGELQPHVTLVLLGGVLDSLQLRTKGTV